MPEPDLKGLSREFVLKAMIQCAKEHDGMHCHSGHRDSHERCQNAILCTPENCIDPYAEDEDELAESYCFVHSPGGGYHHRITAEMVTIIEVKAGGSGEYDDYGCTHTIEMCYTNGTNHEWHATYGVNEETDHISCWAD